MVLDENVRREIVAHAQVLFQRYGMKKTTMDEIASSSGRAKSTIYHYFKSKDDVFDAVLRKELQDLRKHVKALVDKEDSLCSKFETYLVEYHKEMVNKGNLYRLSQSDWFTGGAVSYKRFDYLRKFERDYIKRLLEDGIDTGEFTVLDRSELDWFCEVMVAGFFGIVRYSLESSEGSIDQDKLVKASKLFSSKLLT
ncbi:hypothetical protein FUAX_13520 [Fulvitalea axinellae]|uniref:HTH tetR-type domain-containing protein n=1 Tax=Fulvitalea axinellae TaxID=1182444 RepID=A0AAU9DDG2_9BACT|nr:hypothetical protein FUAX_13520 [Fulvitalea axinellae]